MSKKNIALLIVVVLIGASIWYLENQKPTQVTNAPDVVVSNSLADQASTTDSTSSNSSPTTNTAKPVDRQTILKEKAAKYFKAKELADIQGYINSKPFTLSDYAGKKVILVDFWTYSCINCQRTIPYLNSWYQKYKDQGLVIVGVHTPEFDFEKNYDNVANATKQAGIQYPVVLDSNRGTWTAYQNNYWPHEYLIDIDGYVVHDHIGEGSYDETEKAIQAALQERAQVLGEKMTIDTKLSVPKLPDTLDAYSLGSPETYFGASRNDLLANGVQGKTGEQIMTEPQTVTPNKLYLIGSWNFQDEYAQTSASVGSSAVGSDRVEYLYAANSVYFVAGSADTKGIEIEVLRDGKSLDKNTAGEDVYFRDGKSYITVSNNKLYKIITNSGSDKHLLEFIISSPGLQAFTFTFG